jgi:hypothetical protein
MKEREKKNTAYHEAGHAIIAHVLPAMDPVQQISIIPSGNALGYTLNPPKEDKYSVYKNELKEKITMLLGGRAAEEIIFGDVSGGASNDIQRATDIAKKMVTQLGMSDVLGLRAFGSGHGEVFLGRDFSSSQDYSDDTASKIDNEIHAIISEAYDRAKQILTDNMDKLHFIAEFLLANEIMDGEQFTAAMEGNPTFEELNEMTGTCIVCDSIADNMGRYLHTFFHLYQNDTEFRKKFESCKGLCLPHASQLLTLAPHELSSSALPDFANTICRLETENFDRIQEDVSWFCRKFDYRYYDEPWKNSRDAVERTVNKLRGWCVGTEPNPKEQ